MQNEKRNNLIIIVLVAIIAVLSTILVLSETGVLNFETENDNVKPENDTVENGENNATANDEVQSGENNDINNDGNNNQNSSNLLTESEALQLGKDLYNYANSTGWCNAFKYELRPEGGMFVVNYEEVASKFTQNYFDSATNSMDYVFRSIKKDENGRYYDLSMCAFGSGLVERTLDLKVVNISENYITFDATITTTGSIDKDYKEIKTQTFGIKKEDNIWKIDVYKFAML